MSGQQEKILQHQSKLQADFTELKNVKQFLAATLLQFCHRYISTEDTPEVEIQEKSQLHWVACAYESNLAQVLKISHPSIKAAIKDLASRTPMREKPSIRYQIEVSLKKWQNNGSGKLDLTSTLSWDHPQHQDPKRTLKKNKEIDFDHAIELRQSYPLGLEDICELFC